MRHIEYSTLGAILILSAAATAGVWPDPAAEKFVQQAIHELRAEKSMVRFRAYEKIRSAGPMAAAAVPALIDRFADDRNTEVLNALLAIGPGSALGPLVEALHNKKTAAGAATMLSIFGPAARPARGALIEALEDPRLRPAARSALLAIEWAPLPPVGPTSGWKLTHARRLGP